MVPKGWKRQSVGDVFEVQLGKMLNQVAKEGPEQREYLTNANVRWGHFVLSNLNRMHFSERDRGKYRLANGDLIVCEGGEVGRCAIWKGELEECYYQKALHRLRPLDGKVIPEFTYLFFEHGNEVGLFKNYSSRSSIAHLTREKLLQVPILLPPLPEQRKIAEILSTWDRAIETTEALLAAARTQKRALMQSLLTGKRRFPEFEGQAWKEVRLGDVASVDKKSLGSKTAPNFEFDYISLSNVEPGQVVEPIARVIFKEAPSRARRIVEPGDLLVSTVRPNLLGFARVTEERRGCIASTGFAVVAPGVDADGSYLFHYLFSHHMKSQFHALVVGSSYPAINSSDVRKLKVNLPSATEQERIGRILDDCDREVSALAEETTKLRTEKKALMQQLLTGKRRVVTGDCHEV